MNNEITYDIVFRKWHDTIREYSLLSSRHKTLEEACAARVASGDLVVYHNTYVVVNDVRWLWPWEKETPDCYAQKAMKGGMSLAEMDRYRTFLGIK